MSYSADLKDKQILALVSSERVGVREMAERLFMSEATVRRRLGELEKKGLVIRTHGGAIPVLEQKNPPLISRTGRFNRSKELIASKAVALIKEGDTVFADSSSTVQYLLPRLASFRRLTVCTNSLRAAAILMESGVGCILLGGDLIPEEQACNSEETFEMIERINADIFFFSCDAMSEDGLLTDDSKESCRLRRHYMKHSAKKVLLIDDSKLGAKRTYTLCRTDDVDVCVCNTPLPEKYVKMGKFTVL